MALVIIAIIVINIAILYTMFTRPNAGQVQRMIEASIKANSQSDASKLAEIARLVPTPTPIALPTPSPKQDTVIVRKGEDGKSIVGPPGNDGLTIIGPKGDKGDIGSPGREVELARDPITGEFYSRYTGDTTWQLITTP